MRGRKRTPAEKRDRGRRLADMLRRYRLRRGLSAQHLGQLSGISPEAIRRIEQHLTHDPGFFTVVDLAESLGVSLGDLAKASKKAPSRRRPEV